MACDQSRWNKENIEGHVDEDMNHCEMLPWG